MREDILFQNVKKQVDAIDVCDLLKAGAPQDEYDEESLMIARQLKNGMTVYSIANIIAQVMNCRFGEKFSADKFIACANQIEHFMNNTK